MNLADELRHCAQDLAGYVADRAVGRERDPSNAAVAVLGEGLVPVQVERDDERARGVGCRQWVGLGR